ncbi:MAG: hypothetical protein ACE5HF_01390 [Gemmatimonadota bacterium]
MGPFKSLLFAALLAVPLRAAPAAAQAVGRADGPAGADSVFARGALRRVTWKAPIFHADRVVGTVAERTDESLVLLAKPDRQRVTIPLEAIRTVERSVGRRGHALTGAAIGFGVGAALSAGFSAAFCGDPDTACQADEVLTIGLVVTAPTTLVGALIGAAARTSIWEEVPPSRYRVGIAPTPGGLAVGLSIGF